MSGRVPRPIAILMAIGLLLPACTAFGPETRSPGGRESRSADPAIAVIDAHHRQAAWSGFMAQAGYGAENLTFSGGCVALETDPANFTKQDEAVLEDGPGDQQYPSVAAGSGDYFIVAWQDRRSGNSSDIYARAVNATTGAPAADEILVCAEAGDQVRPSVSSGWDSRFVVAWEDYRGGGYSDIYAKVFDAATGGQAGGEIAVSSAPKSQVYPSVARVSEDRFAVVWQDFRNAVNTDDYDIYAKVFDIGTGAQAGSEIAVSTARNSQLYPSAAADRKGGFVAAWTDYRSGSSYDIYAKAFDAGTGSQIGSEIAVATGTGSEMYPSVGVDPYGRLVTAWMGYGGGTSWDIRANVIAIATGAPVSGDVSVCAAGGNQQNPSVATDQNGRFIVAWQDFRSGADFDVLARMFSSSSGQPAGGEIPVAKAGDQQQFPSVSANSGGDLFVAWQDHQNGTDWDIHGTGLFHPCRPRGALQTPDFSPAGVCGWDAAAAGASLPEAGSIVLAYSTDSGLGWSQIPPGGSLRGVPAQTAKLRLRAELATGDGRFSPVLWNLTLDFTANSPPEITSFPPDGTAPKNRPLTLAAGTADADNDSLTYRWVLYNPSGASLTGRTGTDATFLATRSGSYTVRLAVRDGYAVSERLVTLTVENHPPVPALAAGKKTANVSEPVTFDASASADADGDWLSYRFHFGDGAVSFWPASNATHVYTDPGTYQVTVEVSDGETTSYSPPENIVVAGAPAAGNRAPVAAFCTAVASPNDPMNLTFKSASFDPDGSVISTEWDFGDGATGHGTAASHRYSREGNFTVRLSVADNRRATNSTSRTVTVAASRNRLEISAWAPFGDPTIREGTGQRFSVTVLDRSGGNAACHWFLDGRALAEPAGPEYTFKPARPGVYRLGVTVGDGGPEPYSKQWLVTVRAGNAGPSPLPGILFAAAIIAPAAVISGLLIRSGRRPPAALRHGKGPPGMSGLFVAAVTALLLLPAFCPPTASGPAGELRSQVSWSASSAGLPTGGNYYGVTFGDVNKDGKIDIVGASDGNGVRVFLGDGAGAWTAVASQPAISGGYSDVRIGDFNGDGNPDIVAGSPGHSAGTPNGVRLWKGNGAGKFTECASGSGLPSSGNWRGIALGDVNGDGCLDIATTSGYGSAFGIRVYTGDGSGKFIDNSTGLPTDLDCESGIVLADFNGDGNLDLSAGGPSGMGVYLGNGGAGGRMSWTSSSSGLPAQRFTGVEAADIDRDGSPDLLLASYNAGGGVGLRAFRNVGHAASWASASAGLPASGDYIDVSAGDFDGDGNVDLFTGGVFGTKGMRAYYGDGAGGWTEGSSGLPSTDEYIGTDVADFNADGSPDLVIGSYSAKGLLAFRNLAAPDPSIGLTCLAGRLSWTGGSRHTISWEVQNGTPPYTIGIAYSTDGGNSYPGTVAGGMVQAAAGPGSCEWTVPVVDTYSARLRLGLEDSRHRTVSKDGNVLFWIDGTPPSAVSSSPADGAADVPSTTDIFIGFSEWMNWSSVDASLKLTGPGNPVLSSPGYINNGVMYKTAGLELNSRYDVTVSTGAKDGSDPGNALVRPFSFSFNTSATPEPAIELVSPSGSEEWVAKTAQEVIWSATGGTGRLAVELELSTNGRDGPWVPIMEGGSAEGILAWTVPDTPSTCCCVCATVTDSNTPPKTSSARSDVFSILPAPVPVNVSLSNPGGGEVWDAGTYHDLTWAAAGGNGRLDIRLQYSIAGPGGPWTDISVGEGIAGTYRWLVPGVQSPDCFIRVSAHDNCTPPQIAADQNDAPFTISARSASVAVAVDAPRGGETWMAGTEHAVAWRSGGGMRAPAVSLAYSTAGAAGPWMAIAEGLAGDGVFIWQVPDTPSVECFVRVTAADALVPSNNASSVTGAAFTISPPRVDAEPPEVRILLPANGGRLDGMVPVVINATDNWGVARLELFLDGAGIGNLTSGTISLNWDTRLNPNGPHTLLARAWDGAGNTGNSTPVQVTLKNPAPGQAGGAPGVPAGWWAVAAALDILAAVIAIAALVRRRKKTGPPAG